MTSILRPKGLRPGDTVAVAALANERAEEEVPLFEQGFATIESLGYRVAVSPLAEPGHSRWWSVATPQDTAAELNRLLRDPNVRGIVALDGGRLALGYLDLVDVDAIRADPKPILGLSDISALLLALHARTGLVGIHGDLVRLFADWRDLEADRRARLADAYRSVLSGVAPVELPRTEAWECWRGGRAEGPLIGAMLNRLVRVQASGFAVGLDRFDGAILFWEEAGAQSSVIWQELHALRTAGVLDRIAGMVVGADVGLDFTPGGPDNVRDIVLDVLGERHIPIVGNVEIGHSGPNIPIPLGVRASMDADGLMLSLLEPAVSG
jgi:muramoyltetrapeptide carboxypeptidase